MDWQYSTYGLVSAISALISFLLGLYTLRRHAVPGRVYFFLLLMALVEWSLTDALKFFSVTVSAKILWSKFSYLGIVSVTPFWLLFTLNYTQREQLLTRRLFVSLWLLPVIAIFFVMTNERYGLIWTDVTPISIPSGIILTYKYGIGLWVIMTYSYVLLLIGMFCLILEASNSYRLYQNQAIILMIAAVAPVTGNVLYLAKLTSNLDLTPIAFLITCFLFALGMFRFHLINITPLARHQLFVSISNGVMMIDIQNRIVDMNPAAQRLLEITSESIGQRIDLVLKELDLSRYSQVSTEIQTEIGLGNSENPRWLDMHISPLYDRYNRIIGKLFVLTDITDRKKEEENRLLAGKLQSLGTLAGGIAHDFNNLLTAILGYIQMAILAQTAGDMRRYLIATDPIIRRSIELTQQLLTFAKGGEPVKQNCNLNSILGVNTQFFSNKPGVKIKFSIEPNLWFIYADSIQLWQVIQNLIYNAMESGSSVIEISAVNLMLNDKRLVQMEIKDNGSGIPSDIMSRIFDPYFTTKPNGNGLGLAICHSVIQKHNGEIHVKSEVGKGATFVIHLPASYENVSSETKESLDLNDSQRPRRILVLDDEQIILDLLSDMLTKAGYEAITTKEGIDTIQEYINAQKKEEPFAAVIIDLNISGDMRGEEVLRHLQEIDPNVKAIVSSAYSDEPIIANFKEYGFFGVLPKPYRSEDLMTVLSRVLKQG